MLLRETGGLLTTVGPFGRVSKVEHSQHNCLATEISKNLQSIWQLYILHMVPIS